MLPELEVPVSVSRGRRLRSQTARRARPWATEARRETVHGVLASKSLSRISSLAGSRYAANTYGRAVEDTEDRDSWRNARKDSPADPLERWRWWARYDSSPLLKANEPRGRAESESRRSVCSAGGRCRQDWNRSMFRLSFQVIYVPRFEAANDRDPDVTLLPPVDAQVPPPPLEQHSHPCLSADQCSRLSGARWRAVEAVVLCGWQPWTAMQATSVIGKRYKAISSIEGSSTAVTQ